MQDQQELCGFLLVDKPNGRTSSDCVLEIRNIVGRKSRVGHAGTLDAFATGLLIIGVGRTATKNLSDIMTLDKIYHARAKLGQLTDTLDLTGIVLEEQMPHISREQLDQAIKILGSGYKQTPPVYSALKHQGKALSRLARKEVLSAETLQKITEEKSRDINLYSCKLLDFTAPFFTIEAHVSHGTYIRSLMNDIARQCNTYATTHELRRLVIGPFSVDAAKPLRELNSIENIQNNIISVQAMQDMLSQYQRI